MILFVYSINGTVNCGQREREREARKCHYVHAGARRCRRIDIMHLHIYGGAAQLKPNITAVMSTATINNK